MLFDPTLSIRNKTVKISFIRRKNLERDLKRVMGTTRINNYLITNKSGYIHINIHIFFVLEFYYILEEILNYDGYKFTNVRTIKQIQKLLLEETWLKDTSKTFPSRLKYDNIKRLHFPPLDYQEKFIKHYDKTLPSYHLRGMMLAAEPGTGKTYTAIAIAECLDADRIIVVAPKPAVNRVWVTSVANDKGNKGLYHVPQSCWTKMSGNVYQGEKYAIFHYEALEHAVKMVKELQGKKTVIILDESHNLNEIKSLRTQRFLDLCDKIKTDDILFMTGTPIKALSLESIPLLKAIDPFFDDEAMGIFKKLYSGSVVTITKILTRRYNLVSYRIDKSVTKLNEPIYSDINVTVDNPERFLLSTISQEMADFTIKRVKELTEEYPVCKKELYDTIEKYASKLNGENLKEYNNYLVTLETVIEAYNNGRLSFLGQEMAYCNTYEKTKILPTLTTKKDKDRFNYNKTVVKYLKLKARGECLGQILVRKRIDAYKALLENIPFEDIIESTEKKTVIFTTYTDVIKECLRVIEDLKYSPLAVYGEHTKNLSSIVDKFEKKEHYNPLIATYASLSTAVPLIMADTMIILNPPFRQYIMDQTIARIHRLGATTQTRIFNIILDTGDEENISTRTINIMEWSKEQVNLILGTDLSLEEDDDAIPSISTEDIASELAIREFKENSLIKPKYLKW